MKKIICSLLLGFIINPKFIIAQVSGNEQYNSAPAAAGNYQYKEKANYMYDNASYGYQQDYMHASRYPVSTANFSNNTEINITVNGLMNLVSTNYVAVFNIVQVAENPEATDTYMSNRISRFKQELKKIGIDTNDIKTDMLSFVPKYEFQAEAKLFSKTYNEVPAGFELSKNVSVRFKNSSDVDAIVTAAAAAEIYDLAKVDYFVPDIQKSLDSLRLICLKEVKAKGKSYEILGFKLDTLKKVITDNFVTTYPQTRYFTYKAFSRPSLPSTRKKPLVNLNDATNVNSRFYNQIDYDHYDVVVNPVITEPVVQLSYSVAVKYFLKDDDKPKNNYYIIGANGDIHQFNPK